MNLFAKDTLGIAFDDGEGSISWGWPIFSFVFALVLARLTATGLVPCDERIDYFVPYYQTWTTSSFEGHVIESESWVLLCGVQNEPLKFLRMKDCHEILEIKKPVWCIYTVNGETGSQLLVGVGDRIQLHSLPEMSLLLSIDLLDSVFHPNTASRYRSTSPPRLFLNNGWLLIECETSMRQLDGTGERYIEIAGWNRFSVGWSKSENPNPDFRKKLKIDLDSQSQPILCLDPINPILTIATIECALEVNLETGVSV